MNIKQIKLKREREMGRMSMTHTESKIHQNLGPNYISLFSWHPFTRWFCYRNEYSPCRVILTWLDGTNEHTLSRADSSIHQSKILVRVCITAFVGRIHPRQKSPSPISHELNVTNDQSWVLTDYMQSGLCNQIPKKVLVIRVNYILI